MAPRSTPKHTKYLLNFKLGSLEVERKICIRDAQAGNKETFCNAQRAFSDEEKRELNLLVELQTSRGPNRTKD